MGFEFRDERVLRQPFKKGSRFHFITEAVKGFDTVYKTSAPTCLYFQNPIGILIQNMICSTCFCCCPGFSTKGTDWPIFALLNSYEWTYPGIPPGNDYDPWRKVDGEKSPP